MSTDWNLDVEKIFDELRLMIPPELIEKLREIHDRVSLAGRCPAHEEGLFCCVDRLTGNYERGT